MAKYQKLQEPVFIVSSELIHSHYSGGEVYEVHLMGIASQSNFKTYVDPANANWSHWEHIISRANSKGIVLTNCKLKDPAKGLINADSNVTIEYMVSKEELADILEDYWKSQSRFNKLFGDGDVS